MSFVEVQTEIMALLNTIPNVNNYRGRADDKSIMELDANADMLRPYNTISFGGFVDPGRRGKGIVGAAYDSHIVTIVTRSVATSDHDSMRLWEKVLNLLLGYVPKNCGEISAALYGGVGEISSLGNPTRFAAVQAYKFMINSDKTMA